VDKTRTIYNISTLKGNQIMEETTGKSRFNMSVLILQHIGSMLQRSSDYYRNGRIDRWFYEWKNIKFQIIAELNKDERDQLQKKEKEITKLLKDNRIRDATSKIEGYLTLIQDHIKEKEIGLVEKSDETVFA